MQEKSFLEVLIDQILAENSAETPTAQANSRPPTSLSDWDSSPAYLAYLLAHPPTFMQKNFTCARKNPYFSPKGKKTDARPAAQPLELFPLFSSQKHNFSHAHHEDSNKKPQGKQREFSIQQQQALLFFHMHQYTLDFDFRSSDLKKAYRQLAQKLHPDRRQDGNNQAFIALQRAYEILQKTIID